MRAPFVAKCAALLAAAIAAPLALAYIGPGAGISVVGSLLNTLLVILLAVVAVIAWPMRYLWRRLRRAKPDRAANPD